MLFNCKNCGQPFDDYYGVCPKCGTPLTYDLQPPADMPAAAVPVVSSVPAAAPVQETVPVQEAAPVQEIVQPPKKPKKKSKAPLIAILCSLAVLAVGGTVTAAILLSRPTPEQLIEQHCTAAQQALKENRYEDAEKDFLAALEIDSTKSEIYNDLTDTYLSDKQPDKAVALLQEYYDKSKDPEVAGMMMKCADYYAADGQNDNAVSIYRTVISMNPDSVRAYQQCAKVYVRSDDEASALKILSDGVRQTGDSELEAQYDTLNTAHEYQTFMADADRLSADKQYLQAAELYLKAAAVQPKLEQPYLLAGNCYELAEDFKKAREVYEQGYTASSADSLKEKADQVLQKNISVNGMDFTDPDTITLLKNQLVREADASGGTINLVLWVPGEIQKEEKKNAEAFIKLMEDPRYTIKISVRTVSPDDSAGRVLSDSNDAADVFVSDSSYLPALQKGGAVSRVNPLYTTTIQKNHTPESVDFCRAENSQDLLAFPFNACSGSLLFYDKRVISEKDAATFDTLIAKAAKAGKNVYYNLTNSWYSTDFFLTAGCDISVSDGKQTISVDNNKGLIAAKAMCHLAEKSGKGLLSDSGSIGDYAAIVQGFEKGTIAAAVAPADLQHDIITAVGAENLGVAKLPTVLMDGKQQQLHSLGASLLMEVNVFSKFNFASQTLACYLTSAEVQSNRYQTSGYTPTNLQLINSTDQQDNPVFKAIAEQRPFEHDAAATVSSAYWAVGDIRALTQKIIDSKGAVSDKDLNALLQKIPKALKQ